jgi:hypothetical protein
MKWIATYVLCSMFALVVIRVLDGHDVDPVRVGSTANP